MAVENFADFVSPAPHPGEPLREAFVPGYHLTVGAARRLARTVATTSPEL
jgi:hypothetical protein